VFSASADDLIRVPAGAGHWFRHGQFPPHSPPLRYLNKTPRLGGQLSRPTDRRAAFPRLDLN